MKLGEIIQIGKLKDHGIESLEFFDDAIPFKNIKIGQYELLYKEDTGYYFCLNDGNKNVAYLMGVKSSYEGRPCMYIKRSWVLPQYRNKGLMKDMYSALINNGFILLSDSELSPESISIWKYFNNKGLVKTMDITTGEEREAVDSDFMYPNEDTRFIIS